MMASKRASHDEGKHDMVCRVSKRRHGESEQENASTAAVSNTMTEQLMNVFESLVRRVVREELPPLLQRYISLCPNRQSDTSGGRALQLRITNKLPPTIFTLSKIIAQDGAPLQIELRDASNQSRIVMEEGSSMKIKLCVLDADFASNGSENWAAEEFNANILSPRDGKGPLLNGDTVITLKNGVGYITNKIEFSDNSSRTRTRKFRLGVKIVQSTFIDADIREGISEPFTVLDKRGEGYKKHEVPSLNDEVWRLKKIGKNSKTGKKLDSNEIKTVKDFLQLYITNQASLKEIIGKVPRKSWDTMIEHAKACDIDDDERYIYHCFIAEKSITLVFNCIYEVVKVSFNGQNTCSLETLNLEEKSLVERAKQQAYTNLKDLMPLETTTQTLAGVQAVQHGAADHALQQFDLPIAQQGQPQTWPNLCEPSASTLHIEATHNDQLDFDQLPLDWLAGGQFIGTGAYNDGNKWPLNGSHIDQFASWFSLPNGDGAECTNHFCFPNSTVYISSKGKRKTVWHKIRSALKWAKLHVHKRKAKQLHCQYC